MDQETKDKLRRMGIELPDRPSNVNLAHDQITPEARVSTGVIWNPPGMYHGAYWQVETWCFSSNPAQRSFQRIHGTHHVFDWEEKDGTWSREWKVLTPSQLQLVNEAQLVHSYIVRNLRAKFNVEEVL